MKLETSERERTQWAAYAVERRFNDDPDDIARLLRDFSRLQAEVARLSAPEEVERLANRLDAPAYWISGSSDGHEGDNEAPSEAAALLRSQAREIEGLKQNAIEDALLIGKLGSGEELQTLMRMNNDLLARAEAAERERDEAQRERDGLLSVKANAREYAKLLVRLRDRFICIRDRLEDEGDRVYFGSTNDADAFKSIIEETDEWKWEFIMAKSVDGPDIYRTAQVNHARSEAAEAALAELTEKARNAIQELVSVTEVPSHKLTDTEFLRATATIAHSLARAFLASLPKEGE